MSGPRVDLPIPKEPISLGELDKRISVAANFLHSLDNGVRRYGIDAQGRIIAESSGQTTTHVDLYFDKAHQELLKKFTVGNNRCAEQFSSDPGVIDAKVINGCVVVVYDSSKKLPIEFRAERARGDFTGPTDFSTKDSQGFAKKMHRLGLITIDLNAEKRKDGVSASVSLQHELAHHNVSIVDAILTDDPQVVMKSGYRRGRNVALFGDSRDRLTTSHAFELDKGIYATILNRDVSQITQSDMESQLFYLDELHASALQRKEEWFNATKNVYFGEGHQWGKHWELVGRHPDDVKSAQGLLRLLQAIRIAELQVNTFKGRETGVGQQYLMKVVPDLMNKSCAIIGASRTVEQARRLINLEWQKFAQGDWAKKLITNEKFKEGLETVYTSGWAVPGLQELFTV